MITSRFQTLLGPGTYAPGVIPIIATPVGIPWPPEEAGTAFKRNNTDHITAQENVVFSLVLNVLARAGALNPIQAAIGIERNEASYLGSALLIDLPVAPDVAVFSFNPQIELNAGDRIRVFWLNLTNADPIEIIGGFLSGIEIL